MNFPTIDTEKFNSIFFPLLSSLYTLLSLTLMRSQFTDICIVAFLQHKFIYMACMRNNINNICKFFDVCKWVE